MIKLTYSKLCSLLACVFLLMTAQSYAQCTGCTTTYASSSAANITISTGQTICINSGVTMSGQIYLNGGVLCNSGTVNNLKLSSGKGQIKNYGLIKDSETSIAFAGNVLVYCYSASQFSFASVSINMGSIDSLYFNLASGADLYFASDLSISSRRLAVYNAGKIRITSNFNVNNAALWLYNAATGTLAISGSVNQTNTGNKTISNSGIFTVGNAYNIGGNGSSATSVLISNNNYLGVTNNLENTMTNAYLKIINNASSTGSIAVGQDVILNIATDSIINKSILAVGRHINTKNGVINNEATITCAHDFSVSGGRLNNYNRTTVTDNMIISSGSEVKDYGLLNVGHDFKNSGKFRFGQQGLLKTANYYHFAGDTIFGASLSLTDTAQYARLSIGAYSQNTGYLRGKLIVYDETLVNNTAHINYGLDSITTLGNIDGNVLFVEKTISPGNISQVSVITRNKFYFAQALSSAYSVYCGTPITLSGSLYLAFSTFNPNGNTYSSTSYPVNLLATAYTWQPGSLSGASQVVTPTSTTTYTLSIYYTGNYYTSTVSVNVIPTIGVSTSATDVYFAMPDAASLTATPSGGSSPYTYNWSPNAYFVNSTTNTQQNPQVSPPTSQTYTVKVTDANGCPGTATVNVIAEPYAHLLKLPDGGYYKLFNNKLLFKYDGQYATTGLVCNIYNKFNKLVTTGSFSSLVVNSGDNRYSYNATPLATGYYVMEIINEKKEKLFLRFTR